MRIRVRIAKALDQTRQCTSRSGKVGLLGIGSFRLEVERSRYLKQRIMPDLAVFVRWGVIFGITSAPFALAARSSSIPSSPPIRAVVSSAQRLMKAGMARVFDQDASRLGG